MDICIKIIPKDQHRPEVDGCDWYFTYHHSCGTCKSVIYSKEARPILCCDQPMASNEVLEVRLSPLGDWRQEALLGLHEAFEAVICKYQGVSQQSVDAFDQKYDSDHPDRPDLNAGDELDAPYRVAHCYATAAERILSIALEVPWKKYDDNLATLYPGPSKNADRWMVNVDLIDQAAKVPTA